MEYQIVFNLMDENWGQLKQMSRNESSVSILKTYIYIYTRIYYGSQFQHIFTKMYNENIFLYYSIINLTS